MPGIFPSNDEEREELRRMTNNPDVKAALSRAIDLVQHLMPVAVAGSAAVDANGNDQTYGMPFTAVISDHIMDLPLDDLQTLAVVQMNLIGSYTRMLRKLGYTPEERS